MCLLSLRFPPTIFYKIYTHGNVVDLGSFAPREYHLERLSLEQGNILPGAWQLWAGGGQGAKDAMQKP